MSRDVRRLQKTGRFWTYTPTPWEMEMLRRAYRLSMKDALSEANGGAPVREEPEGPSVLMFGGGTWATSMVFLETPKPMTFRERLRFLFWGED